MTVAHAINIDWKAVQQRLQVAQQALESSFVNNDAGKDRVFRERAQQLATLTVDEEDASQKKALLIFESGGETFGLSLQATARVFPETHITPTPGVNPVVVGIANLQGEIRSIVDFARLLSLEESEPTAGRHVVLLRRKTQAFGLLVSCVQGIRSVALDQLHQDDEDADRPNKALVRGVASDGLIVLDEEALFAVPNQS